MKLTKFVCRGIAVARKSWGRVSDDPLEQKPVGELTDDCGNYGRLRTFIVICPCDGIAPPHVAHVSAGRPRDSSLGLGNQGTSQAAQ
jgi:hypothetical protein